MPEGVEGRVPYKGRSPMSSTSWWAACAPAWATAGCRTIEELRTQARFIRITAAGLKESHVHDVTITKEAPNYRME